MESIEIIWIIAVVAVSAFAQSLAGFGFGLLAVPLMTLFVDAHDAVIVATMIGAVSTIAQALLDREHCEWPTARRLSIAAYAGMP
ncbi:MAG: TSUP family transporter, partial [Acidimicrobiaceae bacterium]